MKRSVLVACVVLMMVFAGVSSAFAGVGYYSANVATKVGSGCTGTGTAYNRVSDMKTVVDVTYKHQVWGYAITSLKDSDGPSAVKPYYIYASAKVMYVTWHLVVGNVYASATESFHNASPYTASSINSGTAYAYNYGGIAKYAYTSGSHQFRYNAAAALYTWGTYVEIRNPNPW